MATHEVVHAMAVVGRYLRETGDPHPLLEIQRLTDRELLDLAKLVEAEGKGGDL